MFKKLWYRIREWFVAHTSSHQPVFKELVLNEYKSVLYTLHRADTLQKLIEARTRIEKFNQLLKESRLEYWGNTYVVNLSKLWNAKFRYWKEKARS